MNALVRLDNIYFISINMFTFGTRQNVIYYLNIVKQKNYVTKHNEDTNLGILTNM